MRLHVAVHAREVGHGRVAGLAETLVESDEREASAALAAESGTPRHDSPIGARSPLYEGPVKGGVPVAWDTGPWRAGRVRRQPRADGPDRPQEALADARGDVLCAVHDHARQHGRERRAARDPA